MSVGDNIICKFESLRELSNASVCKALCAVLDKTINMDVPDISLVPVSEMTNLLDGPEKVVVSNFITVTGDISGYLVLVQKPLDAYNLACLLTGKSLRKEDLPENGDNIFDEINTSALEELTNIITGAFLSSLSKVTGLSAMPSVPEMLYDMAGALMSIPAIAFAHSEDPLLLIQVSFQDVEHDISGKYFLIPDSASYNILLERFE